jgi:hypothetical protein
LAQSSLSPADTQRLAAQSLSLLIQRSAQFIRKYGITSVFLARFTAVVRAFVPLLAGIMRMSSRQFYVKPPPMASTSPPTPEAASERRRVTVMFCDLVDSTGIAAKLDAEEWRDLVGAYLDAALAAVLEMGGKVAKKLGDGLMALFGYPVAQENDAERAVRAALAMQRALAELNRKNADTGKPALAARIAIDQGRWLSMRRARYSATCRTSRRGHRRWRSRVRSWSRHGRSDRSRVCSSPKSA